MYLKYFLESGIFAQDSKDSEFRTLFYFVTDPSAKPLFSVFLYGGRKKEKAVWPRETMMRPSTRFIPFTSSTFGKNCSISL